MDRCRCLALYLKHTSLRTMTTKGTSDVDGCVVRTRTKATIFDEIYTNFQTISHFEGYSNLRRRRGRPPEIFASCCKSWCRKDSLSRRLRIEVTGTNTRQASIGSAYGMARSWRFASFSSCFLLGVGFVVVGTLAAHFSDVAFLLRKHTSGKDEVARDGGLQFNHDHSS